MRRKTCRNGFVFVTAMCLGLMVMCVRAGTGSLYPPAGPESTNSAMWTLNDIYNVLDTHTTNLTKRASFAEPMAVPTNGTMHTLDDIMALATNRAPVPKTGKTTTSLTRDDGALKLGVAWPNPRFSPVATNGAETNQIRDNLTGLIWARNANIWGATNWGAAVTNCNNLIYGGTNDWRLPNVRELYSLIDSDFTIPAVSDGTGTQQWTEARGPFTGIPSGYWWTSTPAAGGTTAAWEVMYYGCVAPQPKSSIYYVWPVRGGQ